MVENALAPEAEVEYPAFATPHPSWIVKKGDHTFLHELTLPVEVARDGSVSVIVPDAKTEALLADPYVGPALFDVKSPKDEAEHLQVEIARIKAANAHAKQMKSAAKLQTLLEAEAKRRGKVRLELLERHALQVKDLRTRHADELAAFEAANREISEKLVAESEAE